MDDTLKRIWQRWTAPHVWPGPTDAVLLILAAVFLVASIVIWRRA